jgi:inhibitor of KinA
MNMSDVKMPLMEVVHIPVCYDVEFGVDLSYVADHNGLDHDQVVEIHSNTAYLVHMIGFLPGFPYLGGMSERIRAPRLETPRVKIPAGSVGIAGGQTGVYPIDSPGGWRIIGRTPVKLFDMDRRDPALLKASQYIKFEPISRDDFFQIEEAVKTGSYELKVTGL